MKMLLGSRGVVTPTIDEMTAEGNAIGAYGEHGWRHEWFSRPCGAVWSEAFTCKMASHGSFLEKKKPPERVPAVEVMIAMVTKNLQYFLL